MPELPEVETAMRGLRPVMEGQSFVKVHQNRPNLRFEFPTRFVQRLEGARVEALQRRAKYLIGVLSTGEALVMHLGMSGRFVIHGPSSGSCDDGEMVAEFYHQPGVNSAHTHVVMEMSGGAEIHYNDARRFGFMILTDYERLEQHKLFSKLGVEPLSGALSPNYLAELAVGKNVSIKAFLMDQRVIAGLGNIYVCEALHLSGISPLSNVRNLVTKAGKPTVRAVRLVAAIQDVLEKAIDAGGSSLRDHRQADGSLGYFQHQFFVYGRAEEACHQPDCSGTVARITQNGRSSFYCPRCQRG